MAAWLEGEGDRRTVWLATVANAPVGMASVFEYRRMPRLGRPGSRWGYISNMFVREDFRNRGYARLVLSPSERAVPFYRRAGFVVPSDAAENDRLLVRPADAGAIAFKT